MAYYKYSAPITDSEEKVGYNLLEKRNRELSELTILAIRSYLRGNIDAYYFSLVALKQCLKPDCNSDRWKILEKQESKINIIKSKLVKQESIDESDLPGVNIVTTFKKENNFQTNHLKHLYIDNIKKFHQTLLVIMKKVGFYPGKEDDSEVE